MSDIIRVPLNSPAFTSYLHEGWRQTHVDGLWATLRHDKDYNVPSSTPIPDRGGDGQHGVMKFNN